MGRKASGFLWLIGGVGALGLFSSGDDKPKQAATPSTYQEPSRTIEPEPTSNFIQTPKPETLFTTANLNLRQDPSTKAAIVAKIPKGASVEAEGARGDWRNVLYRGQRGWVSARFLSNGQPLFVQTEKPAKKPVAKKEPSAPAKARTKGRSGCDPNYTPCVPIASDVDCADGSGNGPAYVDGPVRVIGRDIYGLDRNRDGVGCE